MMIVNARWFGEIEGRGDPSEFLEACRRDGEVRIEGRTVRVLSVGLPTGRIVPDDRWTATVEVISE